ncbi:hypothetical protein ACLB2K_043804 [Fragaria x ananassa]
MEIGSFLQAEADCSQAINLDKKNVKAYFRRGSAREVLSTMRRQLKKDVGTEKQLEENEAADINKEVDHVIKIWEGNVSNVNGGTWINTRSYPQQSAGELSSTHSRDPILSPPKYKIPRGADTKIGLRYYKISGRSWINAPDATVFNVPKLVARKLVSVNLSDVKESPERRNYIDFMAKQLSGIGVPGCDQLDVLEKIFDVIDVTVRGRHIIVFLADVTVQLLDNASNLGEGDVTLPLWINGRHTDNQQIMLQRLMMDFRCGVPKGSPATLSSIQDLEKVRLDSLEAAVRQMDCAICMEDLDHFYAAEEGNDHHHMIVRLPCSHMYHEDCIGQWLENNQSCVAQGIKTPNEAALAHAHVVCSWFADCYTDS